jgi:hypothetical protein
MQRLARTLLSPAGGSGSAAPAIESLVWLKTAGSSCVVDLLIACVWKFAHKQQEAAGDLHPSDYTLSAGTKSRGGAAKVWV